VATNTPEEGLIVHEFHYCFDAWDGDAIVTSVPCFIVTESLARRIEDAGLTGATFDKVEVTTSEVFDTFYPDCKLPKFLWLKPNGTPGRDDFGLLSRTELIVSEHALALLKEMGLDNAVSIEPFDNEKSEGAR
jgi:hypothetical protein